MSAGNGLGIAWSILEPLIRTLIYVFIFTVVLGIRLPGAADQPFKYSVYVLQGIVPWFLISSCISGGTSMVHTYAGFIRQPSFPFRVLPDLIVLTRLPADFVGLLIIFILMAVGGQIGTVNWPLLVLVYLMMLVAARGMATICGAITVVVPDFRTIINFVLMLSVYLSPVFYMPSQMKHFIIVGMLNPFSYMLTSFKYALNSDPSYTMFSPTIDISVLALIAIVSWLAQRWTLNHIREAGIDRVA